MNPYKQVMMEIIIIWSILIIIILSHLIIHIECPSDTVYFDLSEEINVNKCFIYSVLSEEIDVNKCFIYSVDQYCYENGPYETCYCKRFYKFVEDTCVPKK